MNLVIHCGFHKTGSTSFQGLCANNRAGLRTAGIHYPKPDRKHHHNPILHQVQQEGLAPLRAFLGRAFEDAHPDCHTVLISGEAFENCIVDTLLASAITDAAHDIGFADVEWVAVVRPAADYIRSQYNQFSKVGVVVDIDTMRKAARERGCFYASTKQANNIYVFDLPRFSSAFRKNVNGKLTEIDFKNFVQGFAGSPLLQRLMSDTNYQIFCQSVAAKSYHKNISASKLDVERRHILNALKLGQKNRRLFNLLVTPLALYRRRKMN